MPEDEQECILNELDEEDMPKNEFKEEEEDHLEFNDPIKHGPAHSGKKCFDRINNCIKSVLRKKLPLTLMETIEQELLLHFKDDPTCIYQACLESSYARLILHACAQYYDLNCRSEYGFNALYNQSVFFVLNHLILILFVKL